MSGPTSGSVPQLVEAARLAARAGDGLKAAALAHQAFELDPRQGPLLDELARMLAGGGTQSPDSLPPQSLPPQPPSAQSLAAQGAPAGNVVGQLDIKQVAMAVAATEPASTPRVAGRDPNMPEVDVPLLSSLPEPAFVELLKHMPVLQVLPGQALVEAGDPGDCMFIVVEGRVAVHRAGQRLAILSDGDFFGELSVLANRPRAATVTSVEPTKLFRLDRSLLFRVSQHFPEVLEVAKGFARRRLANTALAVSDAFGALDDGTRDAIAGHFELTRVDAGAEILEEGGAARGIYVILAGRVEVIAGHEVVAELGEGELVGEISTLFGTSTTATVRAADETVVLHLPAAAMRELLERNPDLNEKITELGQHRWALV